MTADWRKDTRRKELRIHDTKKRYSSRMRFEIPFCTEKNWCEDERLNSCDFSACTYVPLAWGVTRLRTTTLMFAPFIAARAPAGTIWYDVIYYDMTFNDAIRYDTVQSGSWDITNALRFDKGNTLPTTLNIKSTNTMHNTSTQPHHTKYCYLKLCNNTLNYTTLRYSA